MSNDQLLWWFKDKVLGDTTDPKDYFDQTVNIEVDKLVSAIDYERYAKAAADEMTDRMYNEHGNNAFANPNSAYRFYGRLLSISNLDKIKILHTVIGD